VGQLTIPCSVGVLNELSKVNTNKPQLVDFWPMFWSCKRLTPNSLDKPSAQQTPKAYGGHYVHLQFFFCILQISYLFHLLLNFISFGCNFQCTVNIISDSCLSCWKTWNICQWPLINWVTDNTRSDTIYYWFHLAVVPLHLNQDTIQKSLYVCQNFEQYFIPMLGGYIHCSLQGYGSW